ncbi:hypothetical protein M9Y10_043809 [Tritrichomonas musculus]|uniref:DUF3447 domain-containing protein n=1 Tax=Tritrichomonas musculus TaxID=1915356 RepID=A0ABR2K3M9_9EUKA
MYLDNYIVGYAVFNNKKYLCCERINNSLIRFFKELLDNRSFNYDEVSKDLEPDNLYFIREYYVDKKSEFNKMRKSGELIDEFTLAIRKDDINKVKSIFEKKTQFSFFKEPIEIRISNIFSYNKIPFNIFESFIDNGETNYINYSAAYGSVNCFIYLFSQKNDYKDKLTLSYAVFGQNKEIIEMVIQKNISTDVNNEPVNNSLISYAKDDQKENQRF